MKWNDLKRDSKQDITFDWDDILNMQGNSGPYLQYSYVRTQSVLNKSQIANSNTQINSTIQISNLEKEENDLLRFLAQYEYYLEVAAGDFAPNVLCTYLFELAQRYNLFYQKCKVIGSNNEEFRTSLTRKVGETLKNGLEILGIETVERM